MFGRILALALPLVLLLACLSNAQVYLGPTGTEWDGTCAANCPQSSPCMLAVSGSTTLMASSPCTVIFESGMTIPQHSIGADVVGNLTFSSLGPISVSGDFSVQNSQGGIVLQDFNATTDHTIKLNSTEAYIINSSFNMTGTSNSQISLVECGVVVFEYSNITSVQEMLKFQNLAPNTVVYMFNMNLETKTSLLTMVVDTPGNEPSLVIRNSFFLGIRIIPRLASITLENVVGIKMFTSFDFSNFVFDNSPPTLTLIDTRISAPIIPSFFNNGPMRSLVIIRCDISGFYIEADVSHLIQLENTTISALSLSFPLIICGFTSGTMVMANVTLSAPGTMGIFSLRSGLNAPVVIIGGSVTWNVTDLTINTPDVSTLFQVAVKEIHMASDSLVFPTFASSLSRSLGLTIYGDASSTVIFTGNISAGYHSEITFSPGFGQVEFHSINVGDLVSVNTTNASSVIYHVTKPSQGIICGTGPNLDCITLPLSTPVLVSWESSQSPTVGQSYPFISNLSAPVTFSSTENLIIVSSFEDDVSSFSFLTIPCPSNCIPANSGPCNSTTFCTCKEGYEGVNCEISPISSPSPTITVLTTDTPTSSASRRAPGLYFSLALIVGLLFWC